MEAVVVRRIAASPGFRLTFVQSEHAILAPESSSSLAPTLLLCSPLRFDKRILVGSNIAQPILVPVILDTMPLSMTLCPRPWRSHSKVSALPLIVRGLDRAGEGDDIR